MRLDTWKKSWHEASDDVMQSLQHNPERLNKMGGEVVLSKNDRSKLNYDIRNREKLIIHPVVAPRCTGHTEKISFFATTDNCNATDPKALKK
jgi:hypothetical protein